MRSTDERHNHPSLVFARASEESDSARCEIRCRDRSLEHKRLGLFAPPGSKLAEFIPAVAPQGDEIVIEKTASGVFISTNIEYILRNLCVSHHATLLTLKDRYARVSNTSDVLQQLQSVEAS